MVAAAPVAAAIAVAGAVAAAGSPQTGGGGARPGRQTVGPEFPPSLRAERALPPRPRGSALGLGSRPSCRQRLRPREVGVRLDACGAPQEPTARAPPLRGLRTGECSAGLCPQAPGGGTPASHVLRSGRRGLRAPRAGEVSFDPRVPSWSGTFQRLARMECFGAHGEFSLQPHKAAAGAGRRYRLLDGPECRPPPEVCMGGRRGLSGSPGAGESGALSLEAVRARLPFSCDSPGGGLWRAPQTAPAPGEPSATALFL